MRKYKICFSYMLFFFILICNFSCTNKYEKNLNQDIINFDSYSKNENLPLVHNVLYKTCTVQYEDPSLYYDPIIPSGYSLTTPILFRDYDSFDNFIKNDLKEDYNFIIPNLFKNEIFNTLTMYYRYRYTKEIMNTYFEDNTGAINSDDIIKLGYNFTTGFGSLSIEATYNPNSDSKKLFDFPFRVSFGVNIGSKYYDYLLNNYNLTGNIFNIYDTSNYIYTENRIKVIDGNQYSIVEFLSSIVISNKQTSYVDASTSYYLNIYIKLDNESMEIYNTAKKGDFVLADELVENIEGKIYPIYDFIYDLLIDSGYKQYSNIDFN